ncbi:MAG TPA: DUF3667 domain-containing protein [Longimicrobium sp.]|nr:DUF3667 domain-containing protein [Longimicrobium sp.]
MAIATPPPQLRVPIFRATERKTPDRPCTNCGDFMPGNFCRHCGQRKVEVRISLRRMLMEVLDDQFSLNSALPRTVGGLFFRPGHLTREYMNGRIARYIPPFRLYLVASVAFFIVLSMLPELRDPLANTTIRMERPGPGGPAAAAAAVRPPVPAVALPAGAAAAGRPGPARVAPPVPPPPIRMSFLEGVQIRTGNAELDSLANARIEHFRRMEARDAARQFIRGYLDYVPQMMFLMLPLFAGLLKLLYVGGRRFYVEHFVFALHLHAFAFLTYLVMIGVRWPPLVAVLWLWLFVYLYVAMKRVYGQGWFVTALKYVMLGVAYSVAVSFAAGLTFIATVLTA